MNRQTIRQAVLAYLERRPSSEWISGQDVKNTILGRPYESGDYFYEDEDGARQSGPRQIISDEMVAMLKEGLIEYRPHAGWRISTESDIL